jgi:methyl-accepting chemotaxis protein
METCEKLAKCPFYQGKMDINSGLGLMYKKKYCEGDKTICARYIVATQLGPEFVTNNLYPNMNNVAEKLLAENGK